MDVHCAYCVVGEYFRCNESIWWKRFEWSFISLSFPKQNYIILWWDWVGFQELHLQFRGSIFRSGRESRNLSQQSHQSRNLSQQSHQSRNLSLQLSRSAGHPPNLSSSPSIPRTHTHTHTSLLAQPLSYQTVVGGIEVEQRKRLVWAWFSGT